MSDIHRMIVYHICKIIGGISIRFNQYHIVKLRVFYADVPIQFVVKGRCPLIGNILADDKRNTGCKLCFYFLLRQRKAMLVIHHDFLPLHNLCLEGIKPLFITETIIRLTAFYKLFRIFHINSALHAFTLDIRTKTAVLIGSLIVFEPRAVQRAVNNIRCALHETLLIRILYPKHEIPARMLGNQKLIQCRPQITDMHFTSWAWRISCSYLTHCHSPFLAANFNLLPIIYYHSKIYKKKERTVLSIFLSFLPSARVCAKCASQQRKIYIYQ